VNGIAVMSALSEVPASPAIATTPAPGAVVSAEGLTKSYGTHRAVDGIDLQLPAGATLALIGHNGAGKTTLMKLLLGLVRPGAGGLRVLGREPHSAGLEHRRQIGFLPENVAFHDELTGTQTLRFYARLKRAAPAETPALLARVGLAFAAERRVKTYSKGMRQRLGLAQALLGTPRLMLLDEPTTGLDPASRGEFFRILRELSARGVSVIISSHILTELEAKTDLIAIMSRGRLAAFGPLAELRRRANLPVKFTLSTPAGAAPVLERLGDLATDASTAADGRSVEIACRIEDKMAVLARLAALGAIVADVDISRPGLDEVYRHFSPEPASEP
jgi:Cu-processing system ATP-binding protein